MTPREQDLRGTIAAYDAAITQANQLEYVSCDLSGHPNLNLVRQRWQLELLRAGAIWELTQLEKLA